MSTLSYNHINIPGTISSLIELSAKAVAAHIPFAVVESYPEPIPEDLQLKIAFWSFPDSEEDIRYCDYADKKGTCWAVTRGAAGHFPHA